MDPMMPSTAARVGRFVMLLLPFTVALGCVFLSFVPLGQIFGLQVSPAFGLMAVYYWAVNRPEFLPPYAVFLVGLAHDLLSAGPVGLWAFLYLVCYGLVVMQRLLFAGRSFMVFWIGFGLTCLLTGALAWVAACLYHGVLLAPGRILFEMVATFILFPPFARVFEGLHHRLGLPA